MAESRKSEERQINESLTMEESETYSWWSGHKQRGHCQENHNNPPKKIDIWEPVAEVKRSPPMGLRSLVLAPFLISSFLAENCRMRSLNTFELVKDRNDSQFWLIWGYLVTPIWGNVHVPRKPLMFFNWVSSYPRGQIRPPKRWAWSPSYLWFPHWPRALGRRPLPPSWFRKGA